MKVRHRAGHSMSEILSNSRFVVRKTETLYALVYTLFLDNDKEMRIFRGLSKNVFLTRILDKR